MTGVSRISGGEFSNGPSCQVTEYGAVGEADMAEAVITGRYPEQGFVINHESNMMIRVISGAGIIAVREAGYELHTGSVVRIDKETPYYYEGDDLRLVIVCSPAWNAEQYSNIE